ncbi:MAG: DeoR/GlpR family DNA-binding transcription regulator [Sulfitobacter sp.]
MSKYTDQILYAVEMRGTVTVLDLANTLGVSDQTIRRVSQPLVDSGDIKKVHGALVSSRTASDPPFMARMKLNRDAKVAIAKKATEIIKDGDSLAIDAGSTSGFVALALRARKDLNVVTNSAFVASTLAGIAGNRVTMAGNQLRDFDGAAFDRNAFEVIERSKVDYVVLSASIVNPHRGFLVHEQCEVDIANAMFNSADRSIMAVDHSKFNPEDKSPALCQPPLRPDDIVITDRQPPVQFAAFLSGLDLKIA